MGPAQLERRHHPRHSLTGLRVRLPVSGRVLNASVGGIAIEATKSLRCGWSYAFKLGEGRRAIRIPGKVAWCRLTGRQGTEDGVPVPVFDLGISLAGSIWDKARTQFYP